MNSSPPCVGQHAVVQVDLGQAGNGPHDDVFDARLGGGGDGDRIAVAAQAGRDPEDVDLLDGRFPLRLASVGDALASAMMLLLSRLAPGRLSRARYLRWRSCTVRRGPSRPRCDAQQIRGNCSPASSVTTRSPPTSDRSITMPGMLGHDLADDRRVRAQRMAAHRLQQRARRPPAARRRSASPRWRRRADRGPASRRRRAPRGGAESPPRRARRRRRDAAASSLRALDRPPRVGSRMQRMRGHASSIASVRSVSGAVSLSRTVSNSSPRAPT